MINSQSDRIQCNYNLKENEKIICNASFSEIILACMSSPHRFFELDFNNKMKVFLYSLFLFLVIVACLMNVSIFITLLLRYIFG